MPVKTSYRNGRVPLTVKIHQDVFKQFSHASIEDSRTKSQIIEDLLKEHIRLQLVGRSATIGQVESN